MLEYRNSLHLSFMNLSRNGAKISVTKQLGELNESRSWHEIQEQTQLASLTRSTGAYRSRLAATPITCGPENLPGEAEGVTPQQKR